MEKLRFNRSQEEFIKSLYNKICDNTKTNHREKIAPFSLDIVKNNPEFRYIPQPIQSWISAKERSIFCKKVEFEIQHRKVTIYLIDFSRNSDKKYQQMVRLIKQWLSIVSEYASEKCAATLSIYLYLTPFKKEISEPGVPMDLMQINTASTRSCMADNSILIFRKEEWFKVFIHETFHCSGLDFSSENTDEIDWQIRKLYVGCDPCLDVRFYETYCEVWATVINILFIMCGGMARSLEGGKTWRRKPQPGTRKSRERWNLGGFIRSLDKERKYSMYQTAKVLAHDGITYRQLIGLNTSTSPEKKYREKTQIFSYYILKSNIMFFMCGFWDWVENVAHFSLDFPKKEGDNNGMGNNGMKSFFVLIRDKYNNTKYIEELENIDINKDSKKYKSMKMTVHGDFFS
jgi:hypothetical protein